MELMALGVRNGQLPWVAWGRLTSGCPLLPLHFLWLSFEMSFLGRNLPSSSQEAEPTRLTLSSLVSHWALGSGPLSRKHLLVVPGEQGWLPPSTQLHRREGTSGNLAQPFSDCGDAQ